MTWNHLGLNNTRPAVTRELPENLFIIFVDRIFTTFIECPFTNVFDANREITGNP